MRDNILPPYIDEAAVFWIGLNDLDLEDSYVWDAGDNPGFTWTGGLVIDGGHAVSPISAQT